MLFWGWETFDFEDETNWFPLSGLSYLGKAREKRMLLWRLTWFHLAEHSRACQENVMVYAHGLKVFWEFTNLSNLYRSFYLGRRWFDYEARFINTQGINYAIIIIVYGASKAPSLKGLVDHNHFSKTLFFFWVTMLCLFVHLCFMGAISLLDVGPLDKREVTWWTQIPSKPWASSPTNIF